MLCCAECGKPFSEAGLWLMWDGTPLCPECYRKRVAASGQDAEHGPDGPSEGE